MSSSSDSEADGQDHLHELEELRAVLGNKYISNAQSWSLGQESGSSTGLWQSSPRQTRAQLQRPPARSATQSHDTADDGSGRDSEDWDDETPSASNDEDWMPDADEDAEEQEGSVGDGYMPGSGNDGLADLLGLDGALLRDVAPYFASRAPSPAHVPAAPDGRRGSAAATHCAAGAAAGAGAGAAEDWGSAEGVELDGDDDESDLGGNFEQMLQAMERMQQEYASSEQEQTQLQRASSLDTSNRSHISRQQRQGQQEQRLHLQQRALDGMQQGGAATSDGSAVAPVDRTMIMAAMQVALEKNRAMQASLRRVLQGVDTALDVNYRKTCMMEAAIAAAKEKRGACAAKEQAAGAARPIHPLSYDAGGAGRQGLVPTSKLWTPRKGRDAPAPSEDALALVQRVPWLGAAIGGTAGRWGGQDEELLRKGVRERTGQHVWLQQLQVLEARDDVASADVQAFMQRMEFLRDVPLDDERLQAAAAQLSDRDWEDVARMWLPWRTGRDCRAHYLGALSVAARRPWTQEELDRLAQVAKEHSERHWGAIARALGTGRPAAACLKAYAADVGTYTEAAKQAPAFFTPEESEKLRQLVEKYGAKNWAFIQRKFGPTRTLQQLHNHWDLVLRHAGTMRTGPWELSEDLQLLHAVAELGRNWQKVAQRVGTRTRVQCRDRFTETLDPSAKRGPLTEQEQATLRELVAQQKGLYGHVKWARLARFFPGRTDKMIRAVVERMEREERRSSAGAAEAHAQGAADAGAPSDGGDAGGPADAEEGGAAAGETGQRVRAKTPGAAGARRSPAPETQQVMWNVESVLMAFPDTQMPAVTNVFYTPFNSYYKRPWPATRLPIYVDLPESLQLPTPQQYRRFVSWLQGQEAAMLARQANPGVPESVLMAAHMHAEAAKQGAGTGAVVPAAVLEQVTQSLRPPLPPKRHRFKASATQQQGQQRQQQQQGQGRQLEGGGKVLRSPSPSIDADAAAGQACAATAGPSAGDQQQQQQQQQQEQQPRPSTAAPAATAAATLVGAVMLPALPAPPDEAQSLLLPQLQLRFDLPQPNPLRDRICSEFVQWAGGQVATLSALAQEWQQALEQEQQRVQRAGTPASAAPPAAARAAVAAGTAKGADAAAAANEPTPVPTAPAAAEATGLAGALDAALPGPAIATQPPAPPVAAAAAASAVAAPAAHISTAPAPRPAPLPPIQRTSSEPGGPPPRLKVTGQLQELRKLPVGEQLAAELGQLHAAMELVQQYGLFVTLCPAPEVYAALLQWAEDHGEKLLQARATLSQYKAMTWMLKLLKPGRASRHRTQRRPKPHKRRRRSPAHKQASSQATSYHSESELGESNFIESELSESEPSDSAASESGAESDSEPESQDPSFAAGPAAASGGASGAAQQGRKRKQQDAKQLPSKRPRKRGAGPAAKPAAGGKGAPGAQGKGAAKGKAPAAERATASNTGRAKATAAGQAGCEMAQAAAAGTAPPAAAAAAADAPRANSLEGLADAAIAAAAGAVAASNAAGGAGPSSSAAGGADVPAAKAASSPSSKGKRKRCQPSEAAAAPQDSSAAGGAPKDEPLTEEQLQQKQEQERAELEAADLALAMALQAAEAGPISRRTRHTGPADMSPPAKAARRRTGAASPSAKEADS